MSSDFAGNAQAQSCARAPCVVISQPMYFPWVGMLEQIRVCDVFVNYEDVQFSRGSFSNRVQIKTATGIRWLTVPLQNLHLGQAINEVKINQGKDWKRSHRDMLRQTYAKTPYLKDALDLVDAVFAQRYTSLADLSKASMMALVEYFGLEVGRFFVGSSSLGISGSSTQRVIDLCATLSAGTYLTGHGARNYLAHEQFETRGIDVAYIKYGLQPYSQSHGEFTPYVSGLDLVAHCGREGIAYIAGKPVPWRDFILTCNE